MSIGSVQLIAVGFEPDGDLEGRVLDLLRRLDELRAIRILDLLFVHKERSTGDLVALSRQGDDHGAVIGALLGFPFDGVDDDDVTPPGVGPTYGLARDDVEALGEAVEPGMSAGLVLVEHRWAADLARAMKDAGAFPLADGFLTVETVADVAVELDAARAAHESSEWRPGTPPAAAG